MKFILYILTYVLICSPFTYAKDISTVVDYAQFLGQHDMKWDRMPDKWTLAPYSGNGNIGFTVYQHKQDQKNQISINCGRHDYYDHRLPHGTNENIWVYTCRLPLGRFQIESLGEVTGMDLQLSLHNAELKGTVTTSTGSYALTGYTHSTLDNILIQFTATDGESVKVRWIPAEPKSSVRDTLEKGGGPKGGSWDAMKNDPYPMPPAPEIGRKDGYEFCKQVLYQHRGETTTAWEVKGAPESTQTLRLSIHHSFPEKNSLETALRNLEKGKSLLEQKTFLSSHQKWWHDYYAQSFLTLNDPEKEAFYWIQMYKLGSAMRGNGPIMDLMGPWYERTFWPMVWGDLNVQLQYWTPLTSNRLSLGDSLPNNVDKFVGNLKKNVPKAWQGKGDLLHLGTCFPQDFISGNGACAPDMLCWLLHNYWLLCKFDADEERLREKFFPLLKQTMNTYMVWLGDARLKAEGPLELPVSWSPEYPAAWDENCNFTIGLMKWAAQTLLDLNEENGLKDPLAPEWKKILDRLPDFQVDEGGLRIAKDTPFDIPHRHYSHLLAFYPLAVIDPGENKELLRKSVDHWLAVTRQKDAAKKANAMPVTGYTATGAASMYAWLKDPDKAYYYLDFLIQHKNVSPTTMYAEGNPVIESPLSFCTALHDMVLQSYGRKNNVIRVLPACPKVWPDLAFHHLRAQGAFLVSAKRKEGKTQFVKVESLAGSPCRVEIDFPNPIIKLNGKTASITPDASGIYTLPLKKGESAVFSVKPLTEMPKEDRMISPIPVSPEKKNLFGFSKKTERLPSHTFYLNR